MKKSLVLSLVVLLCLCIFHITAYGAGVPQKVLDTSLSVVYIESNTVDGVISGSGFVIRNDASGTYIATNNHVIGENPSGIFVWTGEDEKRSASVVASSEQYDLAVIKLSEPIVLPSLELMADTKQGDEVYAVGFPAAANYLSSSEAHLGSEVTITNGIISSIRSMKNVDYGPDIQLLQINADINEGNSGGPLLNDKGQVVGINTYGVINAQGIFGAISAGELIEFLKDNGLYEPVSAGTDFPLWAVYVGIGVVAAVLLGIFIPKLIRKRRNLKGMPLGEYLSRLGKPLDAYAAVSLMMPVVRQIRDSHNNGTLYLKLSPSRIMAKKDGFHLVNASDNPTDDFLSPEQRNGLFAGVRADVYGVCALLRYILEYGRGGGQAPDSQDAATESFYGIIHKGLSENPDDRQTSMQELLTELSPFNTGVSLEWPKPQEPVKDEKIAPQAHVVGVEAEGNKSKKRKLAAILISVGAAVAVLLAVFVWSIANYQKAVDCSSEYQFAEAEKAINQVPFASQMYPEDVAFIEAGRYMENREYDKALETLGQLSGDAVGALKNEVKYRKAAMLADKDNYDAAVKLYKELGNYKNSPALVLDTLSRKSGYLIEKGDFSTALGILIALKEQGYIGANEKMHELYYAWGMALIEEKDYLQAYEKLENAEGFSDSEIILNDLQEIIYYIAIDDYHMGKYNSAHKAFSKIGSYRDTSAYVILCEAHLYGSYHVYKDLKSLVGFEDASELIMVNYFTAKEFLLGFWKGDGRYFRMKEDGRISYDIPWINYGDYYRIEDGLFLLYKEKTPNITKKLFAVNIISKDCITIFAYKNGRTYLLYRQ